MFSELDVVSCNMARRSDAPPLSLQSDFEAISKCYLAIVLEEEKLFLQDTATVEVKMELEQIRSKLNIPQTKGLECSKCKASNVQYVVVAKRSADEGMLSRCVCRVCGHNWTMNS